MGHVQREQGMIRTWGDISKRVKGGVATVLTAREVDEPFMAGRADEVVKADVATAGTMSIVGGSYTHMSVQIRPPGIHSNFRGSA